MHSNLSNEIEGYKRTPSLKISLMFTAIILGVIAGIILVSHNNSQAEKLIAKVETQ